MTTPLRLYRWGDSLVPDWDVLQHSGLDTGSSLTQMETSNPGDATHYSDGFVIRSGAAGNNLIRVTNDNGDTVTAGIDAGGYTGTALAAEIQSQVRNALNAFGFSNDFFRCDWEGATHSQRFNLGLATGYTGTVHWTYGDTQSRLGDLLGYDTSSDLALAGETNVADDYVYRDDSHWTVWGLDSSIALPTIECVVVGGHNLATARWEALVPSDRLILAGSNMNHGADWQAWESSANYYSEQTGPWDDGISPLAVWYPGQQLQYWALFVRSGAGVSTPTATSTTRLGCVGAWSSSAYTGSRQYAAPYQVTPRIPDQVHYAATGGGSYQRQIRPYYEVTVPIRRWDRATYLSLERLLTYYGRDAWLLALDPDDPQRPNHLLVRWEGMGQIPYDGPEHVVSTDLVFRQIAEPALED